MRIVLIQVGETEKKDTFRIAKDYAERINNMCEFDVLTVSPSARRAKKPIPVQKKEEAENILKQIKKGDRVYLLDEHGIEPDSRKFAGMIESVMISGCKRLVFVIGGPHGLDPGLNKKGYKKIALSRLTFPHQLVRLLFAEQLYRALTIIRGLPYHND